MPGTLIQLYDGDTHYLTIRPFQPSAEDAIVCKNYDLGAPEVKTNVEERVGRNGVNDNTSLHGASVAKFDLVITPNDDETQWEALERLKGWLDPTKRYYLQYQRYGPGEELWSTVYRAEPWSLVVDKNGGNRLEVSVALSLPEGVWENEAVPYTLRPQGIAAGWSAPWSAPWSLTPSSGTGAVDIPVGGTRPVPFRVYIYGAQFAPVIMDTDTGRKISFTALGGLDIPLGSYVELDTEKGTALMNGDPNNSVYQYIDFSVSSWWALRPNDSNRITVSATTSDSVAQSILYVASRRL